MTSSNSQPVFTPDSLAERELEQTEADTLGAGLPLAERLSTGCTLSLNEAFPEVLENSSDKLSFRMSSDFSSKSSSKFSFGFSPESSDLDVDWKKKQRDVLFFISGDQNRLRFERVHAYSRFSYHGEPRNISLLLLGCRWYLFIHLGGEGMHSGSKVICANTRGKETDQASTSPYHSIRILTGYAIAPLLQHYNNITNSYIASSS